MEIEAPGPNGALRGTYVAAPSNGPVALILPGSGATDRHGNNPMGLNPATYRLLAEALAQRRIGTVRIDKRGAFGSAAAGDPNAVTIPDYVHDTRAWVSVIRQRTGQSCVWLIGHSEGGLIALAAAQEPEGLCGLVLIAAPGRRMSDIMREQLRANPANAPLLDGVLGAIDRLERGETVDVGGMHPAAQQLFAPALQGYLRSLYSYDPAQLAARVTVPLLVVQGDRDIQVSVADARLIAAANPKAQLAILPRVNHVLKHVATEDRAANVAAYANPALPLAAGVAETIAGFIAGPGQARR